MTVVVHLYWLPIGLTVFVWAAAVFWPRNPPSGGMYDFNLNGILAAIATLIVSLVIWLVWFAYLAWSAT